MNNPASSPFLTPSQGEVDDFVDAAGRGDIAVVMKFLDKHSAAVDRKDVDSVTALRYAARNGHDDMVALLLERGGDVNLKSSSGWTALMEAVRYGHKATVELLLERGAAINDNDNYGMTILIHAVWYRHEDITELLLERGAPIDNKDAFGRTALMCAEQKEVPRIAALIESWPEILKQRQVEKARQQAEQRAQFLKDTDFSTGLKAPIPAPRPFKIRRQPKP